MTRDEMTKLYKNAKHIFAQSRLPDVRRAAKEIAMIAEAHLGQQDGQPAENWKV